jgi:hypothetical protein
VGEASGRGKLIWPNVLSFEGHFKDGSMHGWGTLVWADGDTYEGEFKDGEKSGSGKLSYADGSTYKGEFRHNSKNGRGKFSFPTGSTYEGEFKDGTFHGHGLYTQAYDGNTFGSDHKGSKGDKYDGSWRNGKMDGEGTYTFSNGVQYPGVWTNGICAEFAAYSKLLKKCGIGVTLEMFPNDGRDKFGHIKRRAGIYISEVFQATGAFKARLRPNTLLLKVDGQSVGVDIKLATQLLRGIEGSQVNVIVEIWNNQKKSYEQMNVQVERRGRPER